MASFAWTTVRTAVVTMLLSAAAATSAAAQASTRVDAEPDSLASWYRDPRTAQTLGSFIPGAGHMYAGETLRGLGLGGAAVVGIASGIVFLNRPECHLVSAGLETCDPDEYAANRVYGITQLAVGVAAWVFGSIDAPHAAQRANARARSRVSVAPFLRDDLVRQPSLGVAVTIGW